MLKIFGILGFIFIIIIYLIKLSFPNICWFYFLIGFIYYLAGIICIGISYTFITIEYSKRDWLSINISIVSLLLSINFLFIGLTILGVL